jgi:hypothetical protein
MFYICWGKKTLYKTEGIAADFCAICRRASAVEVRQIRSQSHVYHIGIGQGEFVGRLCRCTTCGSEWALQAGTIQTSVNPTAPVSIDSLLAETYPRFVLVNGERLEQEAALARDPFALDQQTRVNFIAEPFFILENDFRREENANSGLKMLSGVGCLGAIGFAISTAVAFSTGSPAWGWGWLVVTIGLAWLTLRLSNAATDRYMRRRIYPRLASCLAPVRPTPEELAQVVPQIQAKCASDTKLNDFLPFLEAADARIRAPRATSER